MGTRTVIGFILRYSGSVPRAMRKEFRKVTRKAWMSAGIWWHSQIRPKHFTPAGAREYGYTPRQGERMSTGRRFPRTYTGRKVREHGHRNPLMFTGQSRLFTRLRDVRATSKGVRVVMRAGNLRLRPPGGKIDMADELTRFSRADERAVGRVFQQTMNREMNAIRFNQRVDTRKP